MSPRNVRAPIAALLIVTLSTPAEVFALPAPGAATSPPTRSGAERPIPGTGTLKGVITDQNGAPLPGVKIELVSAAGVFYMTVTDGAGRYSLPDIAEGTYTWRASIAGFQTVEKVDLLVRSGDVGTSNASLSVSITTEAIVVGEAPALDVSRSAVGTTISNETVQKLPVGRVFAGPMPETKKPVTAHGAQGFENSYGINVITKSGGTTPDPFQNLKVVNGKPFPDMFFKSFGVNPTLETGEEPTSTFSVDVDTASYTLARSYLHRGALPEPEGIRVEEFVNSFDYRYAPPTGPSVFALHAEAFPSPSRKGFHVLHIGLKGKDVSVAERRAAHLVFVIDVSGSMASENRLGVVKQSLRLLVDQLDERDTVGIVVYGTNARAILEPVPATERTAILSAIERLVAEGSTNAQAGLEVGYAMAARFAEPGATNRVILCSDGVANNGITSADGIFERVKGHAGNGITITTVGFGMGNYNDVLMERLAQVGNGNYAYVDRLEEARRIFETQVTGTLEVIARDVKVQVEFDRENVERYRLLGYENRALKTEDFKNDRVDAGEVGAGHTVTALYEVKLRNPGARLGTLRIRYKAPDGGKSTEMTRELSARIVQRSISRASSPARLSLLAGAFAEKLRGSYWVRNVSYDDLLALAGGLSEPLRERTDVAELTALVERARSLDRRPDRFASLGPVSEMGFDDVPVLR